MLRSPTIYRPGNLAALRELALLWLADRVDEGLARYRTGNGIEASWPARERIVVGLPGGPEGETLIRRGCPHPQPGQRRRPAGGARTRSGNCGRGIAAGARVTTPAGPGPWRQLSPRGRGRPGRRAAGLRPQRQRHPDRRRNLTQRRPGRTAGGPSSAAAPAPGWSAAPVPSTSTSCPQPPEGGSPGVPRRRDLGRARVATGFVLAVLLPALLQLLLAVNPDKNLATTVLVQLTGSVAVALVGGLWPAILAALWSSLLVNYFSTPPVGTPDHQRFRRTCWPSWCLSGCPPPSPPWWTSPRGVPRKRPSRRAEAATLADLSRGAAGSEDTIVGLLEQALDVFQVRGAALLSRPDDDALPARTRTGAGPGEGWRLVASAGEVPASVPAPGSSPGTASIRRRQRGTDRCHHVPGPVPAGCCRPATGGCSAPSASIWWPSWNASSCWPAGPKS